MYEPFATYSHCDSSDDSQPILSAPNNRRQPLKTLQTIIFNEDVPATPNSIYSAKEFSAATVKPRHPLVGRHVPIPARIPDTQGLEEESEENRRPGDDPQRVIHLPTTQLYTEEYEALTPVKPQVVVTTKASTRTRCDTDHKHKPKSSREAFIAKYRKSVPAKSPLKPANSSSRHSSKGSFSTEIKLQTYEKLVAVVASHCKHCSDLRQALGEAGLSHILREAKW
jgi:hypothetical protein